MNRILDYVDWSGPRMPAPVPSTVTLQSTTLAQSAWELLNRTADDEIGYVHVRANGAVRWINRNEWTTVPPPKFVVGCSPYAGGYDIVTDVDVSDSNEQLRNAVYAARVNGTEQIVKSQDSIAAHGNYESPFRRTDLGIQDDSQVNRWANDIIAMYAFVRPEATAAHLRPVQHPESWDAWRDVLGIMEITDIVRLVWTPSDDEGASIDARFRVTGWTHTVTASDWQVAWSVIGAGIRELLTETVWTMGPHANARLDDGNVIGF